MTQQKLLPLTFYPPTLLFIYRNSISKLDNWTNYFIHATKSKKKSLHWIIRFGINFSLREKWKPIVKLRFLASSKWTLIVSANYCNSIMAEFCLVFFQKAVKEGVLLKECRILFTTSTSSINKSEGRDENRVSRRVLYPTWQLLNLILGAIKLNWVLLLLLGTLFLIKSSKL